MTVETALISIAVVIIIVLLGWFLFKEDKPTSTSTVVLDEADGIETTTVADVAPVKSEENEVESEEPRVVGDSARKNLIKAYNTPTSQPPPPEAKVAGLDKQFLPNPRAFVKGAIRHNGGIIQEVDGGINVWIHPKYNISNADVKSILPDVKLSELFKHLSERDAELVEFLYLFPEEGDYYPHPIVVGVYNAGPEYPAYTNYYEFNRQFPEGK